MFNVGSLLKATGIDIIELSPSCFLSCLLTGKDYYVTLKLLGQECTADLSNVASAKFQELRGKIYDAVSIEESFL